MRSEFQFLQSISDEDDFCEEFSKHGYIIERDSASQWFFRVGDCRIQFLRSQRQDATIAIGRIALATEGFGLKYISASEAGSVYKRMRTWLKNRYNNKLAAVNINTPESLTSYRNIWLGPEAQNLYRSGKITLKSTLHSNVIIKEDTE